jgi:hypothetical protein
MELARGQASLKAAELCLAQQYEDAHVCVYLPMTMAEEEIERLERTLGERCNDILLDTGLFIIGAVCT